jgi:Tfp pilus assembly protein FimV
MSSGNVKKYLEQLKADSNLDSEFIDALIASDINDDDWLLTASMLSEIIDRRYAKSKNNKT